MGRWLRIKFHLQLQSSLCALKMVNKSSEKHFSVIEKYPSYRDESNNGCWKYMKGRRKDDNAEGLWRVHDKLYNLESFLDKHPGGRTWLELTRVSCRVTGRKSWPDCD
jgi:hypothetical protein